MFNNFGTYNFLYNKISMTVFWKLHWRVLDFSISFLLSKKIGCTKKFWEKHQRSIIYFVDPKSDFSLFPRWSHNFSQPEFPQTHPWFKFFLFLAIFLFFPSTACMHACTPKGKRKIATNKERGGIQGIGGLCNSYSPSKVTKERRNIPFCGTIKMQLMLYWIISLYWKNIIKLIKIDEHNQKHWKTSLCPLQDVLSLKKSQFIKTELKVRLYKKYNTSPNILMINCPLNSSSQADCRGKMTTAQSAVYLGCSCTYLYYFKI